MIRYDRKINDGLVASITGANQNTILLSFVIKGALRRSSEVIQKGIVYNFQTEAFKMDAEKLNDMFANMKMIDFSKLGKLSEDVFKIRHDDANSYNHRPFSYIISSN